METPPGVLGRRAWKTGGDPAPQGKGDGAPSRQLIPELRGSTPHPGPQRRACPKAPSSRPWPSSSRQRCHAAPRLPSASALSATLAEQAPPAAAPRRSGKINDRCFTFPVQAICCPASSASSAAPLTLQNPLSFPPRGRTWGRQRVPTGPRLSLTLPTRRCADPFRGAKERTREAGMGRERQGQHQSSRGCQLIPAIPTQTQNLTQESPFPAEPGLPTAGKPHSRSPSRTRHAPPLLLWCWKSNDQPPGEALKRAIPSSWSCTAAPIPPGERGAASRAIPRSASAPGQPCKELGMKHFRTSWDNSRGGRAEAGSPEAREGPRAL